jgi:hypothetical protein
MDMRLTILAVLLAASFGAQAGNDNSNGGCQGNCSGGQPGNASATGGDAFAGAAAGAVAGSASGAVSGSSSSIGDVRNTANGGAVVGSGNSSSISHGGDGGSAVALGGAGGRGGEANQGQAQQMAQGQTSKNTNVNGQAQSATADQRQSNANDVDASSANDNRSSANGNATTVGGQQVNISTHVQAKRNAPSISAGTVFPTASCKGGFGIGGSGAAGGGLVNFSTTDKECQTILLGDHFAAIGMPETACDLFMTTKTWARALKKNPALKVVCDKPVEAPAKPTAPPVLMAPELAARIPRG